MPIFNIPDMTCGHCKETVENAILELDNSAAVSVDLDTHHVDVDTQTDTVAIVTALKTAGYVAKPVQP